LQAKKTLRCGPLHFFFPEYFMSVFSDAEHSIRGFAQRTLCLFLPALVGDRGLVLQAKKTLRCGPLHFFFPEYFMSVFSDVEHSIRGFAQRTLWPFLPAEEDRGEVSATQKPPLFSLSPL
ncbi:hypothetical protein, partial [Veillonella ratti]|uniref:hypothetical protein n=1 Tax=Veillonella ratti TaxID=103892 RepID=UPI0025D9D3DC